MPAIGKYAKNGIMFNSCGNKNSGKITATADAARNIMTIETAISALGFVVLDILFGTPPSYLGVSYFRLSLR